MSAACVISIIIDAPAVSCTPKQIDLQAFLLLQLPYRVSVLLLISGCKLVSRNQTHFIFSFYLGAGRIESGDSVSTVLRQHPKKIVG